MKREREDPARKERKKRKETGRRRTKERCGEWGEGNCVKGVDSVWD